MKPDLRNAQVHENLPAAACKRKTCNGWTFWKYERAPGDWVPLTTLRK